MRCPFCRQADSRVVDSRAVDDDYGIRRRRECPGCGRRFTSFEYIEKLPLMVIKHNGEKQVFDLNKVLHGLIRSCDKRNIPLEKIVELSHKIEKEIKTKYIQEVPSSAIGEIALSSLKDFDEVAYIRFASVYRKFTDISGFRDALDNLLKK